MGEFLSRSIEVFGGKREFRVWRPADSPDPLPAILFLHGAGESGNDNESQLKIGLPPVLEAHPELWPFLVICPQKPEIEALWPSFQNSLNRILAAVEDEFDVDPRRRYLTGLSQGGHGTIALARGLRWNFAALAPVCGWASPESLQASASLPMWAFHGDSDDVIDASWTVAAASWRKRYGTATRVSLYPGVGHDSWVQAYQELELPGWFLSHSS